MRKRSAAARVSHQDYIAISSLLSRYQWLVDEGDVDGWTALWTEDAVFTGGREDRRGHAELRTVPQYLADAYAGKLRHLMGNMHVEYGANADEVTARYYSFVTTWARGAAPQFFTMALCALTLVRMGSDWRIKRHEAQRLR